jgi:Amidohydrolase family
MPGSCSCGSPGDPITRPSGSGGDAPLPGPEMTETFPAETMVEAAARVHAAGGRIAVHATLPHVVAGCVEAGFDSIEHGTLLDPEILPTMAERGVAWAPTLSIDEAVDAFLDKLPADRRRAALDAHRRQPEALRRAVDLGVAVLAGTDAGMGPHGMVREEVRRLRNAGLPRPRRPGGGVVDGETLARPAGDRGGGSRRPRGVPDRSAGRSGRPRDARTDRPGRSRRGAAEPLAARADSLARPRAG